MGLRSLFAATTTSSTGEEHDRVRELQMSAMTSKQADWGYWGPSPAKYSGWASHSNRLIPVYTFGMDLCSVAGKNSVYRSKERLEKLYGYLPTDTLNPDAEYFDQTDIYRLQTTAAAAGKKRIILFIFDGTDWQTTRAAAIYRSGKIYHSGRGTGLHLQDYRGTTTDFGYFVTSPRNDGTKPDVNSQSLANPGGTKHGGYDWKRGGSTPWDEPLRDPEYLIGKSKLQPHAVTDSAASATSMTTGIKTYNDSVNVDFEGNRADPIAQQLQRQDYAIGVVTNVPISHATPAAAYGNNVHRSDYQDLTRDLLGLRSISHKRDPLPGVDVLIGCGWGEAIEDSKSQGENATPGNRYLTEFDRRQIEAGRSGKYVIAERTPGKSGKQVLAAGVQQAIDGRLRLLGFFGYAKNAHLPFRTADGKFDPVKGASDKMDEYSVADLQENPRLVDMTVAALDVLSQRQHGFWLMVEAGDVDWGNHDDNIDCSIGSVLDGDDAVRAITDWIDQHGGWKDTVLIVTADHGHYFHLTKPEALTEASKENK
ncbi:MAG: alkaline phosphatase [Pirellulales bacterium]|nr:alkaline phosphatase [Pirellulales bacterium]